ncbi:MAG: TetR/AcrR family transcriptional regulator [Variibacter sp.]
MAHTSDQVPPTADRSDRDKIIDAFLELLAERRFEEIGFGDVATKADVPLASCRRQFNALIAVYAAHVARIDAAVLEGLDPAMAQESPRERLFDIIMRRLEALAPHKAAMRSLARSARRNPPLALALNGIAARSQQWMLTGANISAHGLRGALRAQGLALLYIDVLRTWLHDDDPGLARTMAALDRALGRGQQFAHCLDRLCACIPPPLHRSRRWRPRDHSNDPGEQPVVL